MFVAGLEELHFKVSLYLYVHADEVIRSRLNFVDIVSSVVFIRFQVISLLTIMHLWLCPQRPYLSGSVHVTVNDSSVLQMRNWGNEEMCQFPY